MGIMAFIEADPPLEAAPPDIGFAAFPGLPVLFGLVPGPTAPTGVEAGVTDELEFAEL